MRYLRDRDDPVASRRLAREVLAISSSDETAATRVLEAAFAGDARLAYDGKAWQLNPDPTPRGAPPAVVRTIEPDRALVLIDGDPALRGRPFRLRSVSALRLHGEEVLAACGGDASRGQYGSRLRRALLETLDGAIPIIHDPPGGLRALEAWLEEPLAAPISLRRLGQQRVGLPASHDLAALVARLGLAWRETEDPLELADMLDACLEALRRPDESLQELRGSRSGVRPIDWSRYAFNREFLRHVPRVPGTYRFYDVQGKLLYVGKSKDLNRRIGSYFREGGPPRSPRVQALLDAVHRIEYEAIGSELEAMLREAEAIRRELPARNVQRQVRDHKRGAKLDSILILEPMQPPSVLRAFLIRQGRLIDRVSVGPRGGGLKRIERILTDYFFSSPAGPTLVEGPDLDVELVVRWLAANRDSVVAFDPTDLPSADEVIERLRWFLGHGGPFDIDGSPILTR